MKEMLELFDKDLKVALKKILSWMTNMLETMKKTEIISKEIESFSKDIENVKKNQSENTKTKIKASVDGLNSRMKGKE